MSDAISAFIKYTLSSNKCPRQKIVFLNGFLSFKFLIITDISLKFAPLYTTPCACTIRGLGIRGGFKGGRRAPCPPGALREGPGYIIAKTSLETRLNYIKITIKVDFNKEKSGFGPHRIFSEGGQGGPENISRFTRNFTKHIFFFRGGQGGGAKFVRALRTQIHQTQIFWPPPPEKILYLLLSALHNSLHAALKVYMQKR